MLLLDSLGFICASESILFYSFVHGIRYIHTYIQENSVKCKTCAVKFLRHQNKAILSIEYYNTIHAELTTFSGLRFVLNERLVSVQTQITKCIVHKYFYYLKIIKSLLKYLHCSECVIETCVRIFNKSVALVLCTLRGYFKFIYFLLFLYLLKQILK